MAYGFNDDKSKASVYEIVDAAWFDFSAAQHYTVAVPANSSTTIDFEMDADSYYESTRRKYNTNDYVFVLAEIALAENTDATKYNTPLYVTGYRFVDKDGYTALRLYVYNPTSEQRSISRFDTVVKALAINKSKIPDPSH